MNSFNTKESFWNEHPALQVAGPFGEIYKKDKTRGKANSSKLAWCIKLIWDRGSDYYNLPEEGADNKVDLIFTDYYGDVKYLDKNMPLVEELRDFYLKITETVAKRTLREIEEKLLERGQFIKKTPYDMGELGDRGQWVGGTVDTLDKMMANTDKLYTLYDKARKMVEQEESQTTMGGGRESLTDAEEI
jgi:hypothetical protein